MKKKQNQIQSICSTHRQYKDRVRLNLQVAQRVAVVEGLQLAALHVQHLIIGGHLEVVHDLGRGRMKKC